MARRAQKDAEKTRARILASALSLFAGKGYDHTTFNDIAARLKMTKGAVYWHFESKEVLLVALVDEMLAKFQRAIANMMVKNAELIVEDPKGSAFFMLMKTQVKWREASMSHVREELLTNRRFGPFQAFMDAVRNDIRAGRVKDSVAPEQVAAMCIAVWDGLVQSRIDHFLPCDLGETLSNAYWAVWESIRKK